MNTSSSARPLAMVTAFSSRAASSSTVVWYSTSTPAAVSSRERNAAFVLVTPPVSSSLPTAMISAVRGIDAPPYSVGLIRIISRPAMARWHRPSTSSALSYSRVSSTLGFVLGCRGVNTVQQSS